MPTYYIDTDDGDLFLVDDEGIELPGDADARLAALRALPDMARDRIPDGDKRTFTVRVTRSDRTLVYSAVLRLEGSMASATADQPAGL